MGAMHPRFLQMIRKCEVNLVAYDYSGYGASTGEPLESYFYENIEAVYEWICMKHIVQNPEEELIVYGQSIGSGPSLYLATHPTIVEDTEYKMKHTKKKQWVKRKKKTEEEKEELEGLNVQRNQGYASHEDIEEPLSPLSPLSPSLDDKDRHDKQTKKKCCAALILHSPLTSGLRVLTENRCLSYFDIFPNIDRAPHVQVPTLIIHGKQDVEVPFQHGVDLYDAIDPPYRRYVLLSLPLSFLF